MMNLRRWLIISAVIFFSGMLIGFLVPINLDIESIAPLGDIVDDFDSFSSPAVFMLILINNLVALGFAFFLSPLLLIVPLFSLVVNGLVVGVVGSMIIEQESFLFLIAGILPHGIIEIPALLLALGASLNFGFITMKGLFKREERGNIFPGFIASVKILAIAASLMIPAALIETFITPLILGLF
jgi:stage II sporulation protein M